MVSTGPIDNLRVTDTVGSVTAPAARSAKIRSSNVALKIDALDSVKVTGSNNSVVAARGTTAKVKGSNNALAYTKLANLVINGSNNFAKVRKGATTVTVHGSHNVVRVHKRRHP